MSVQDKIHDFAKLRNEILKESKPQGDKLSARQRISALCDEGSFIEFDAFVKQRPTELDKTEIDAAGEGVITGYGSVGGRLCYLFSQDYSVFKGSISEMNAKKICKVIDLAVKNGAPLISILDSEGVRIGEGLDAIFGYGEVFKKLNTLSGVIPHICVVLGNCAGASVFIPSVADVVVMSENAGIYMNSPITMGKDSDNIGKASTLSENGVVDLVCKSEMEAVETCKKVLGFLPNNNVESTYYNENNDDLNRILENVESFLPDDSCEGYDITNVIKAVVDNGEFVEFSENYAKEMVVGFASLGNATVGIVANQPNENKGFITAAASSKAAKFIRLCDSFNIPVVTFVDTLGFNVTKEEEIMGEYKNGAKLIHAYSEATTAMITVIIRKAYGSAFIAMGGKSLGADVCYAWPTAEIGALTPDTAAKFLLEDKKLDEAKDEYKNILSAPYEAAKRGYIDDIILPSLTRQYLISSLDMLSTKRVSKLSKKHSNMPL
ncbi:MAG: methylmalonyl-CoA carboxyltransferase [Clostridia bacterium]|nr:methylmalonyl-CoA carboxyltransferase [Clostridia bacterium]